MYYHNKVSQTQRKSSYSEERKVFTTTSTSPLFSASISLARNSADCGKPETYDLKCFFIKAKFFTPPSNSSKRIVCSTKTLRRSGNASGFFPKSHGLPKMPRPIITPSAPVAAALARASSKFFTSPLPTKSKVF